MLPELSKIKGLHPGIILKRELKIRSLKNNELASSINEHPQTLSAILNGKRGINPSLSIKLGQQFEVDNDYFMLLQASYDVKSIEISNQESPNLSKIRKILFWDTDFNKIDWIKNKRAVIKRIFERGNDVEIEEIISYYGKSMIKQEMLNLKNEFLPSFKDNLIRFGIL